MNYFYRNNKINQFIDGRLQPSTSVSRERSFSMLMLMLRRLNTWLTQQTIIPINAFGRHAPKTSGINSSL